MNGRSDSTNREGLRGWWLTPPRPGLQRLIIPWEYRRLPFFGITRVVAGCVAAVVGFICLAAGAYGWAAFFLVVGALALAAGGWFLSIARSESARTSTNSA